MCTGDLEVKDINVIIGWPTDGINYDKIMLFLALTFFMGIIKEYEPRSYWSTDPVLSIPFPRSLMSRRDFFNILTLLHCCDPAEYIPRGPRIKLGNVLPLMLDQFKSIWVPRQEISIDEGTIPFKGMVSFEVYNPNKPDKYVIKPYKVCDSTNGYCNMFDLYVGCDNKRSAKWWKKLLFRLLNVGMVNAYIRYQEWMSQHSTR